MTPIGRKLIVDNGRRTIRSNADPAMEAPGVVKGTFRVALIGRQLEIMRGGIEVAGNPTALLKSKTNGYLRRGITGVGAPKGRSSGHRMTRVRRLIKY
jgi:hypothetical protein